MNPSLDKLKDLEAKYLYMILFGIIAVIAALDIFFLARMQVNWIGSLHKKTVQLNKDIIDLTTNKQRLAQISVQLDIARKVRKNFDAMVHGKDDVPVVLKNISSYANEYGVKLDQLLPQPMPAKPLVQNEDGKYYAMTISVNVRSGYHQLGRFISRMERERLFWQIQDITIASDTKDTQKHNIKMDMKLLILEK